MADVPGLLMIRSWRTDAPALAAIQQPTLRRALNKWDFAAIVINQVIRSAIFLLSSQVAAVIHGWRWIAFALTGRMDSVTR